MTADTQQLLANFVKDGSQSAFRELVARYVDLVYSTAVRLVEGDTHRAEDISQVVFADLARMSDKLLGSATLGGWLHRHTCFVARTVMRGERRRIARERQAAEMNALNDRGVLAQIGPILDEAIQELGADDREAILLRFFERRNLRSVGEALGVNENVAQKRVARAVQELGTLLQRRGVALSATVLAGCLAGAVTAAPAGLALSIAGSILATGTAASAGLTAANLTALAKLNVAIVGAFALFVVVTAILIYHNRNARMRVEFQLTQPQTAVLNSALAESPAPAREPITTATDSQLAAQPFSQPRDSTPTARVVADSTPKNPASVEPATGGPVPPVQPFAAKSGNRIRIEGSSNIHDWQVEGSIIGGFLEIGTGFPVEPGRATQPGPLQARVEVRIPVRSLKSVDKDGRPYSDKMDETMYESLKERQNPAIHYCSDEVSLKGTTNFNNSLEYELETQGELVVAGVTNQIAMPIFVLPTGNRKFRISGESSFKMSSFQVDPPAPKLTLGMIRTADEVSVLFDWVVEARTASSSELPNETVPLVLDLPTPAFKGIPKDLRFDPKVERLSDSPRVPMMVPGGLSNLAPLASLTSSDKNVGAESLAKIIDGDKSASEESIVFLRKGTQWIQMDLGSRQQIFAVVIWHAHNAPKVYHNVIVRVADNENFTQNARILFNNDQNNTSGLGHGSDREYIETYEGKLINTKGVKARFIRFYSTGSTESALNEYTEIEVYGRLVK